MFRQAEVTSNWWYKDPGADELRRGRKTRADETLCRLLGSTNKKSPIS